jgi:hypothetical protein
MTRFEKRVIKSDRYVAKSRTLGGREDRLNRRHGFVACVND